MSKIAADLIQAAQSGDSESKNRIYLEVRPLLRSIANGFAGSSQELEELEQEAALSMLKHLGGYKVGSRASLTTYLHDRVRQDVRNAHFATRANGSLDGDSYAEYTRVAGRVHAEIREERNEGGDVVRDGEVHERMKAALKNLPGKHAWSEDRFLATHDVIHLGTQSMEDSDDNGEEFGGSLVDPYGHGDPESGILTDDQVRAQGVRQSKVALVEEMLETLTDRQAAVVALSYGIGQTPGQYVHGITEGRAAGSESTPEERFGFSMNKTTDDDLAELLGISRASVRARRKEALDKLRKLFGDRDYPTRTAGRLTPAEESVKVAVDTGDYVRAKFFKGTDDTTDVLLQAFNSEGDIAEVYLPVYRAVELGLVEGETVELSVPEAPESYDFMRLFGHAQVPAESNVYDAGHAIVSGIDHGPGSFAVTTTKGAPVGPVAGVDYVAPLWEVPAVSRLHYLGRRAQS